MHPPWESDELEVKVRSAWKNRKGDIGGAHIDVVAKREFGPVELPEDPEWLALPEDEAQEQTPPPRIIQATPFTWRDPSTIPLRQWLYGKHYIRKFTSCTIAPGGLGKSSLGIVDALAMVTGRNLIGAAPDRPLRVWIWNGEDPLEELERRIAAVCLHYGITKADIGGRLFLNSGRNQPLVIAERTRNGTTVVKPVVGVRRCARVRSGRCLP
jgi:hypothetical protein